MIPHITVGFDFGHGGNDSGCSAAGFREADWVWDLGNRVIDLVFATGWPVDMKLTRTDKDHDPTHAERAEIMASAKRSNKADFVFSLHANSTQDLREHGPIAFRLFGTPFTFLPCETFLRTMNRKGEYTDSLTGPVKRMKTQMCCAKAFYPDGSDHWSRRAFNVLQHYPRYHIPAVLFEFGYVSNPDELTYLLSDAGKEACAVAVVASVRALLEDLKMLN